MQVLGTLNNPICAKPSSVGYPLRLARAHTLTLLDHLARMIDSPCVSPSKQEGMLHVRGGDTNEMSASSYIAAIYPSHTAAGAAVESLRQSGFDMNQLSIVGRHYHTDEHLVGYYHVGDRMKVWGKTGAFAGCLSGLLFGYAFLWVPSVGPLLVAGPLVGWIVAALEGAVVMGALSAMGAGLYGLGIPKDNVLRYEVALKTGKFVLIANGSMDSVTHPKEILNRTGPESMEHHQ